MSEDIEIYDDDGNCNFCGCPIGTCNSEECTCNMCSKRSIEADDASVLCRE